MSNNVIEDSPIIIDKEQTENRETTGELDVDTEQEIKKEESSTMKTRSSKRNVVINSPDNSKLKNVATNSPDNSKLKNVGTNSPDNSKFKDEPLIIEKTVEEKGEIGHEMKPLEGVPKAEELTNTADSSVDLEKSSSCENNKEQNSSTLENSQNEQGIVTKELIVDSETFMEPLIIQPDEACSELEFEDSSDKDSVNFSPVLSRCITRRSQNRNILTPNTPKAVHDPVTEEDSKDSSKGSRSAIPCSLERKNLNETNRSGTNVSMTVEVGSNDTRTDFIENDSDFLRMLKSKGSNSSRLYLSSRRSLRSFRQDMNSKSSVHRSKNHISPFIRESMERAPSVKRKHRSETPEERRKILKTEGSGFLSKLSSPLTSLRYKFSSNPRETSIPKLTSYRDEKSNIDGDFFDQVEMPEEANASQKNWCEIM